MNRFILVLGALSFGAAAASAQTAQAPSAAGCARIADVSVPFDVSVGQTAIRFSSKNSDVVVTDEKVQQDKQIFQDQAVKSYYLALRSFLDESGSMARVARSFTKASAFPQAGPKCANPSWR